MTARQTQYGTWIVTLDDGTEVQHIFADNQEMATRFAENSLEGICARNRARNAAAELVACPDEGAKRRPAPRIGELGEED